jgi:RecA/RadA recombinase
MNASLPNSDFIASHIAAMIGRAELTPKTFESVAAYVAADVGSGIIPRQESIDHLQQRAEAAGFHIKLGDDWIENVLARAFSQGGEALSPARAEDDVRPLSARAQAAIEYRRERGDRLGLRLVESDAGEPPDRAPSIGEPVAPARPKFILEPFDAIRFESSEEWLVKRIIPRQGVVTVYGAPQSFKSFVALNLALHVALGWQWAGRRVTQAPTVYIAAEGAAGLRKRKVGFELAHAERLPSQIPFFLIPTAPNLGTEQRDLAVLIAVIEAAGVAPGLIVIDTLAQSLGGGDENGAGMIQFVANATALANHFKCCVLIVHHVGLVDDKRTRGHSSLAGALDAQILAERKEGTLSTVLTLQKLKDDESNIKLTAHLGRIVIGKDGDGDEMSTLIVDRIEDGAAEQGAKPSKSIPRTRRLVMDMVTAAIEEAGEDVQSFAGGPIVRAVSDDAVRARYYARIAEQATPDEDPHKMAERQRRGFNRTINAALNAKDLMAKERDGARLLWLP